jgi:hypothetical protein
MFDNWTKAQKLQWSFGWLAGTLIFAAIDLPLIFLMQRRFPDIDKHLKTLIEIGISLPLATVLGVQCHNRIIVKIFHD